MVMRLTTTEVKEKELERNFKEYKHVQELVDSLNEQREELRKEILEQMIQLKKTKVESQYGTFKLINAHERIGVDRNTLERCYPNVFKKVKKITEVRQSIQYKK